MRLQLAEDLANKGIKSEDHAVRYNLFTFPASATRAIIIESPYEYDVGKALRACAIA
jgi:hypothetical protein